MMKAYSTARAVSATGLPSGMTGLRGRRTVLRTRRWIWLNGPATETRGAPAHRLWTVFHERSQEKEAPNSSRSSRKARS
jgi:hypothetical protein